MISKVPWGIQTGRNWNISQMQSVTIKREMESFLLIEPEKGNDCAFILKTGD